MLPALILAALEEGPAHGYLIARRVQERSQGRLGPREASLYPILHALERRGLVVATWEGHGERLRRVYHLTDAGRGALETEREAWRSYASAVERVLFSGGTSHATV
ncbi:MAG: helix-turn-helix transcriptional regulator [Actinomycetia bacterium]|nr:helix-turn-helix transcriptional regulator [Actinomycetes bacterium]